MKALDANVVLRLMVGDDARQQAVAQELVRQPTVIQPTVLIEAGWVLGSNYGYDRTEIVAFFETLLDHPVIHVAAGDRIRWALRQYAERGDFADLIHIATCGDVDAFATFDRGVAPAAGANSPVPVEPLA